MGAWGSGVLQNDDVQDVCVGYIQLIDEGKSHAAAVKQLKRDFADMREDSDDLFWIGVAQAQWEYGELQPEILKRVKNLDPSNASIDWLEPQYAKQYQRAFAKFLQKLRKPPARPRKRRSEDKRKPLFMPGDCLAYRLDNGEWAAVLVLRNPPPEEKAVDLNIVGVLQYKSRRPPTLAVFEKRQWLKRKTIMPDGEEPYLTIAIRQGFKKYRDRIQVIGRLKLRNSDPRLAPMASDWRLGNPLPELRRMKRRRK